MDETAAPYRVMTVCTGNICRSPMAETVLRARFEDAGLGDEVVVDSSGVSDEESGNPVDPRARRVLERHGYRPGDHAARQVRATDLASRDLVLPMTALHARALRRIAGSGGSPAVRMLRSFDPAAPEVAGADDEHVFDIDDPWYGGAEDFETCLAQIEAAADGIVAHVRAELAAR